MDGRRGVNQSIQFKLVLWISLLIVLMGAAAGTVSFYLASDDAYTVQDDQLKQVAVLLSNHNALDAISTAKIDEPEDLMVVQNLSDAPQKNTIHLPVTLPDGISSVVVDGEEWRVFVGAKRIAVAQRTSTRDEFSRNSGLQTLLPLLALIPCLIVLTIWIVRRAFKPVAQLAHALDRSDERNLAPLPATDIPTEILPFVDSINGLFQRLSRSIDQQNRFIADAAHELRSPITALSVQVDNLQKLTMPTNAQERLSALQTGLQRTKNLLEQLLSLARQQSTRGINEMVDWVALAREVLSELHPLAAAKNMDIGIDKQTPVAILTHRFDLRTLMMNAISNAIRYTPPHGKIDVCVYIGDAGAIFEVHDTGIGIAVDDMERVFEPFYRVLGNDEVGSGLGLSIIKKIADNLGGEVKIKSIVGMGTIFQYKQVI